MVLVRPEADVMKFEKIYAPTVSEVFESRMQHSILSGELQVGERLPTERVLANEELLSRLEFSERLRHPADAMM